MLEDVADVAWSNLPVAASNCFKGAVGVLVVASSHDDGTSERDWASLSVRRDAPRAIHEGCEECIGLWSAATKPGVPKC